MTTQWKCTALNLRGGLLCGLMMLATLAGCGLDSKEVGPNAEGQGEEKILEPDRKPIQSSELTTAVEVIAKARVDLPNGVEWGAFLCVTEEERIQAGGDETASPVFEDYEWGCLLPMSSVGVGGVVTLGVDATGDNERFRWKATVVEGQEIGVSVLAANSFFPGSTLRGRGGLAVDRSADQRSEVEAADCDLYVRFSGGSGGAFTIYVDSASGLTCKEARKIAGEMPRNDEGYEGFDCSGGLGFIASRALSGADRVGPSEGWCENGQRQFSYRVTTP